MKIIRENYKRFRDKPHSGHGRHLSNHYLAKRRSAGDGACLGTLFADHRAQQSSPSVAHLHSDLHGVMGYEAVGGLSSINNPSAFSTVPIMNEPELEEGDHLI